MALPIDFGREICGDLQPAESREWLVTNGIGGFASGTVAGLLTRRYHGLLIAALDLPGGRTLLVSKFDETARYGGQTYALGANRWAGGAVDPQGFRFIERFTLEGTVPVWTFALADALLEKRVWMRDGANTTYIRYAVLRAGSPMEISIKALVNYRDYHSNTHAGDWKMDIQPVEHGVRVSAFQGAVPFHLSSATATVEPCHEWYRNFDLAVERYRGLDDREDHLHAATFSCRLDSGQAVVIVVSTDPAADLDGERAREGHATRERSVAAAAATVAIGETPAWIRQLTLAADQFIVKRPVASDPDARSIIAGYPWFCDWGRDTMVALAGLTLTTGRPEIAKSILRAFSRFIDRGMLPNRFPDTGSDAEYNTVDATLWYFEALRRYVEATGDQELLRELFPVLAEIVTWHVRGTRYKIHVDPGDGLLYAGEPGVQLTWMDAKVGDRVVTPRIGKPVEVNALWYNALVAMGGFARAIGKAATPFESLAERARQSFQKFWNQEAGHCFDVIDGPGGNDASLRPNQIFTVSLPESPLTSAQQRAIVDVCARNLVTSHGLRSLAPDDPQYRGRYGGSPAERDGAYHQGTVWGWLLGPFVLAHLRVYHDLALAASYLAPMAHHVEARGLGTASEIFDGDAPFTPRGCFAQAWTVGEILRAWRACEAEKGAK